MHTDDDNSIEFNWIQFNSGVMVIIIIIIIIIIIKDFGGKVWRKKSTWET
jgi:hypothetical protein